MDKYRERLLGRVFLKTMALWYPQREGVPKWDHIGYWRFRWKRDGVGVPWQSHDIGRALSGAEAKRYQRALTQLQDDGFCVVSRLSSNSNSVRLMPKGLDEGAWVAKWPSLAVCLTTLQEIHRAFYRRGLTPTVKFKIQENVVNGCFFNHPEWSRAATDTYADSAMLGAAGLVETTTSIGAYRGGIGAVYLRLTEAGLSLELPDGFERGKELMAPDIGESGGDCWSFPSGEAHQLMLSYQAWWQQSNLCPDNTIGSVPESRACTGHTLFFDSYLDDKYQELPAVANPCDKCERCFPDRGEPTEPTRREREQIRLMIADS